jgi:hypothetical protein
VDEKRLSVILANYASFVFFHFFIKKRKLGGLRYQITIAG